MVQQTSANIEPVFAAGWDSGDIAWVLVSTALVFMMTFGLAFFYGSLCREKHIIDTLTKTCLVLGLISIQWVLIGFSFAFGGDGRFWGNFEYSALVNLGTSDLVFVGFQMSFAALTSALITGAVVGRMKPISFLIFIFTWTTIVYCPITHWVWGNGGFLLNLGEVFGSDNAYGAIDFAGGFVVEINSGMSAIACALALGKRHKADRDEAPVKLSLNLLGATMLWIGWMGFNGGSALAADDIAGLALINTQICAGAAMFTWGCLDMTFKKEFDLEGALYGGVCGLVIITSNAGFIIPAYALLQGIYGAILSYIVLWTWMKYAHLSFIDDSLYVFCSHGFGGLVGTFSTGLFASSGVNPNIPDGAFYGNWTLLGYQCFGILVSCSWSFFVTYLIMLALRFTIGIRAEYEPEPNAEELSKLGLRVGGGGILENSLIIPGPPLMTEVEQGYNDGVDDKTKKIEEAEARTSHSVTVVS
ncbi:hypothetical protein SARC_10799 [Sphaeroforma arctica JP610]|uniref:Ammonium transporter AmtB-like domain-containing protein n=1 Tax=Sphaeroforma arctica JP610 TaxID=667725 RepID=A0A0L0FIV9_9EUKA|nr:hypothetical protein SARC_10799 [Sphaeroforma arctica JP610]KNC76717.1 hypothetical protein SARC_10799 [Sphaeroforma arctica JP610]|eukprot:XP_014150619.1 hypothetical protein SARC_10799 [Sphaeroforma arctica JP610]